MALWMVITTAVLRGIARNLRKQRENGAKEVRVEQPAADAEPADNAQARADAARGRRTRKRRPAAIRGPLSTTAAPIEKLNIAPSPPGGGAILARCKGGDANG